NFTPKHDKLEVTLLFQDNNELITAVYIFNSENKLQHCYMIEPNGKSIIYDREQEIETIMAKIILIKESSNIIKTTA
ncbi:hypothetical protein, partial [Schnuerera sp.]|uniref:hypothetical protein n=1 Tax=Schnuerera sp. TaxID=2794844 RepID=UPI002B7DD73A